MGIRYLKKELWRYRTKLNDDHCHDITAVEIWLGDKFGTFKGRWNVVYTHDSTYFYFKRESDQLVFALRWA